MRLYLIDGERVTYFADDGMLYWTMGAPVEKTIIINRCKEEDSYENRLKNGTPPDMKAPNRGA